MRTQWNGRVVIDVIGTAGSIVLSDESTARDEIDDDEVEHLTAPVSIGAMSLALGDDRGEALAGSWWKCSDGRITDEADMRDAAEYLRAVVHEN